MSESDVILRELGAITAELKNLNAGQARLEGRLEKVDDRLRTVEKGAALSGAVSGGVIAIAVGLIKGALGGGGN